MVVVTAACGNGEAIPVLDLSERAPIAADQPAETEPLRLAVAAILSPEGNIDSYQLLADFLATELDRPVDLVQRRTYAEINDLLEYGAADIGFVCTSAYVKGSDEFGLRLVAAPEIEGRVVYHSELIVSADDQATSMSDLRGAVFAFTDPMSTSGRIYPTSMVHALGETPGSFFSRTFFTYSHEAAVEAVAEGIADAAGVDSLVLAFMLARDPDLPVKVIDRSPAFGIPPVVASPHVSPQQTEEFRDLLLSLADRPGGQEVLESLGIDRFVPISDVAYDGVRDLMASVLESP